MLLGKHTMSEFAMGAPASLGATPRNPWNLEHTPGGSSSGTGAAVAAALCAGAWARTPAAPSAGRHPSTASWG